MKRMSHVLCRGFAVLLSFSFVWSAADASAQTFARRLVPRGEVTGLEMGIEGSLTAIRGDRVRWYVTLYEVLRRRDLRPSPGSTLEVTASFSPGEPVTTVQTDSRGRAALEIPIPDELDGAADIRVIATSPRNVRRVFSVSLELAQRHDVSLFVDRDDPAAGSTVAAFGRVMDRVTGRPASGVEVTLSARAEGPLMAPQTLTTDDSGVFAHEVPVGESGAVVLLSASTERGSTERRVSISVDAAPLLWIDARPEATVATPGQSVNVQVRVRRADGSAVRGARVSFDDVPRDEDEPLPRTDRAGRVRLTWRVSHLTDESFEERQRTITVVHPGIGTLSAPVRLRVARDPILSAWSVEGGALVPELEGRVHVRLVAPDGSPVGGQSATLEVPRLGGTMTGTTDADGVVAFAGTVQGRAVSDACGGPTATAAVLVVGAHREDLCLPVDPDRTVALHVDDVVGDGEIAARVERRGALRTSAVEVTLLRRNNQRWVPVSRALVPAREDRVSLTPPPGAAGVLWLRARPLLSDARAARGGGVLVYRGPSARGLALDADASEARVSGGAEGTTAVFAVRAAPETALEQAIEADAGPIAVAVMRGRTPALVRALLAARTPYDEAASVILRDRDVVAAPLPEDPVAHGLLRDPWRTRSRFVRGRIGRLMRAVEDYADQRVPDELEEVAVRVRGRWRFNQAVLHAALSNAGLGDETAAALDGEPLDIEGLSQMDRAFTFDNVARRITRERLWRVMVMLREHVRHHGLDRPWARRGDPSEYLATFLDGQGQYGSQWPERSHLFDGWGTPFVLRRAPGGRARFSFLDPVPGWELVSAGPDGRAGTGDDVVDPFARVLPSSGIYAEAVGEDVLLARLGGVALGRATVQSLAEVFEIGTASVYDTETTPHGTSWGALPEPVVARGQEARLTPITSPIGGVGETRPWTMPAERRRYAAVALRFGRDGSIDVATDELEAGLPWAARLTLPTAMRPGERLQLPVTLVQLAEAAAPSVEVSARGGAIEATYADGELDLRALRPGMARVTVHVRVGETEIESFSERVRVVPPGSLRARHSGTMASPEAEVNVTVADDATPWRAHVVIGAPRSLHRDPLFVDAGERHPAIVAWAQMHAEGEVGDELVARVSRAYRETEMDVMSIACALTTWAAEESPTTSTPLVPATQHLAGSVGPELGDRAAVLAALASSAPGVAAGGGDALAQLLARLRLDGWRALASAPDRPAVMARMAAALLLADRRDVPGRALLARVEAALEEDDDERRWVPGHEGSVGDGWVGTLALAIAARQVGDDGLADELARSVVGRLYLAERLGPEGTFWALAASAYGVFGVEAPSAVDVEVDGRMRRVSLDEGATTVSVPPGAHVEVRSESPVWVRSESRYLVPHRDERGALSARLEGTSGGFGERAAFELVVENEGEAPFGEPTVEVTLPGAGQLDDLAIEAIEASESVRRIDPADRAGVVRLLLAPLAEGAVHRIPLPILWIARGRTIGLSMNAYDASAPWEIAVTEGRTLTIEGEER